MPSKYTLPEDHPYAAGRHCSRCGDFKTADNYVLEGDVRAFKGVAMRSVCRPCDEFRKWKATLPKRYGITFEQYELMLAEQNGECAVCGTDNAGSSRTSGRLFVDHCHTSGKVRGLLCHNCNQGIGHLQDDIDRLRSAIEYLTRNLNV